MRTPHKMKAWLVTWEWIGDHAKRGDKVAAILNSQLSERRVKGLVEFLYLTECHSLSEQMVCAQRKRENPCPARLEIVGNNEPLIHCGNHPSLLARSVDDLTVESDSRGWDTVVTWRTRPNGDLRSVALRPNSILAGELPTG